MVRKINIKVMMCSALSVLLIAGTLAYAENMFSVPAKVDAVDLKAKSMKVAYTDPETNATKQQEVYWDKSTEFIRVGPPPDMKESPAKADQISKGMKLYIRITDSGKKGKKLRLDAVRIQP